MPASSVSHSAPERTGVRAVAVRRDPADIVKPRPIVLSTFGSATSEPQEVVDPGFLTNDDVFDETDHAQWQQLREQAAIHSVAMQINKPENHPDFDGVHCVECDCPIPAARLSMQKIRCVDCQGELEQAAKRASRERAYAAPDKKEDSWD